MAYGGLGLLRGGRGGLCPWLFPAAEGEFKFAGNVRPKFSEYVKTNIIGEAEAHAFCSGSEAALIARMVDVAQDDRARRSQPFGKIEHVLAAFLVRQKQMRGRMEQAFPAAALRQAVVTRVLRKYRGVGKVLEEPGVGRVGEVGAEALAISGGTLSESVVRVHRLVNSCVEANAEKRDGIQGVLDE